MRTPAPAAAAVLRCFQQKAAQARAPMHQHTPRHPCLFRKLRLSSPSPPICSSMQHGCHTKHTFPCDSLKLRSMPEASDYWGVGVKPHMRTPSLDLHDLGNLQSHVADSGYFLLRSAMFSCRQAALGDLSTFSSMSIGTVTAARSSSGFVTTVWACESAVKAPRHRQQRQSLPHCSSKLP